MRATFSATVIIGLLLSGCSAASLLGGSKGGPSTTQQIPVNNELAMPPDLSLATPGQSPRASQQSMASADDGGGVYGDDVQSPVAPSKRPVTAAAPNPNDPYEKYGISKFKADGTRKTDAEMRRELQLVIIAEKKKTNPNYGSVFNMGNIFNDE